jgi:hypothetical protein
MNTNKTIKNQELKAQRGCGITVDYFDQNKLTREETVHGNISDKIIIPLQDNRTWICCNKNKDVSQITNFWEKHTINFK